LFPLLSGIIAIYLFYLIARDLYQGRLLASFLFTISWSLIYYSSELKQYSSDVMIGLLLIFLRARCLKENVQSRDFLLLGISRCAGESGYRIHLLLFWQDRIGRCSWRP
jgi:hypothetical protein